jgi:hypothetical protein
LGLAFSVPVPDHLTQSRKTHIILANLINRQARDRHWSATVIQDPRGDANTTSKPKPTKQTLAACDALISISRLELELPNSNFQLPSLQINSSLRSPVTITFLSLSIHSPVSIFSTLTIVRFSAFFGWTTISAFGMAFHNCKSLFYSC